MNSVAIPMRKNFKLKQVGFMMTAVLLLLLLQTLEIAAQNDAEHVCRFS